MREEKKRLLILLWHDDEIGTQNPKSVKIDKSYVISQYYLTTIEKIEYS